MSEVKTLGIAPAKQGALQVLQFEPKGGNGGEQVLDALPICHPARIRDAERIMCRRGRRLPPPPGIADIADFSSGRSVIRDSVVRRSAEIDAAFSRAVRVTFAGSMTPAATRSSYLSSSAL